MYDEIVIKITRVAVVFIYLYSVVRIFLSFFLLVSDS